MPPVVRVGGDQARAVDERVGPMPIADERDADSESVDDGPSRCAISVAFRAGQVALTLQDSDLKTIWVFERS